MTEPVKLPRGIRKELEHTYSTTDVDTATILKALDYPLINVKAETGKRGRKVVFTFQGERIVQDLIELLNDELRLNPREVLNRFREIKNISHEVLEAANKGHRLRPTGG